MDNTLRTDIHPAARGHLAIGRNPHLRRDFPVARIVVEADHQPVGDNHPRIVRARPEQSQRMTGLHHQGLVFGHNLEVFFDEPQLHPVLADAAGLSIGHQFVGVEGDRKIEIIVNHQLESLAGQTVACVFINGSGRDRARGTIAIAINSASAVQFLEKFRQQGCMILLGNIAQGVFQGGFGLASG